jgi:hypothetical protein
MKYHTTNVEVKAKIGANIFLVEDLNVPGRIYTLNRLDVDWQDMIKIEDQLVVLASSDGNVYAILNSIIGSV